MAARLAELSPDQVVWCALAVLTAQFLAIGAGHKADKTFRYIGGCMLILLLMVGMDIWILYPALLEGWGSRIYLDAAQLAFQALACVFLVLLMRFIRHLTGAPGAKAARVNAALLAPWIALTALDLALPQVLLVGLRDRQWHLSPAYLYGFAPHIVAVMGWLTAIAFRPRRGAGNSEGRILGRLRFGMVLLYLGGLLDLLLFLFPEPGLTSSFTTWGVMAFCIGGTFVLADRLVESYRRRRRSLLEIARVYGELGADEPLREIGRSAARVSDAIRSGVSDLRGHLEGMQQEPAGGVELAHIEKARGALEHLATAVLEFSRCGMLGPLAPVPPADLVAACVRDRLPAAGGRIRVRPIGNLRPIPLDAPRLEAALFELLKNALEAGAETVEVRIRQGLGKTVLAIEDDGKGFAEAALGDIVKPFFTTRKAEGAAGLGASIAAGIVRAHGGALRYHARPDSRGLSLNVVLPDRSARPEADAPTASPTLLSDDPARIDAFLAACENLGVRPRLAAGKGHPASVPGGAPQRDVPPGPITEEALLILLGKPP